MGELTLFYYFHLATFLVYICSVMEAISTGILWFVQLYMRNAGAQTNTPGLSLVPKLKYEHVFLTSFSKMRVDLAAQVKIIHIYVNALYLS